MWKKKKKNHETKRKKKQTVFVFCLNLLQDAYIPFLIFLFEEKRKEIWLSSMANTVTKEAKPLRCEQKTHHKTDRSAGVTSNYKNGLVNRFTVSVSPL